MGPRFQYLALLALCLGGTAFLEVRFDARVWRRPLLVIRALALPWLVFNLANEVAVFRGLWFYNASYTTGWTVPRRYPVEEMCFFVAIPICALLTFEAASAVYAGRVVPAPVAIIVVVVSFLVVREASAQTAIKPTTTIRSQGAADARVVERGADPSVLTKDSVGIAVLPTEQPRSVSLKVLATGTLKDWITSVINRRFHGVRWLATSPGNSG